MGGNGRLRLQATMGEMSHKLKSAAAQKKPSGLSKNKWIMAAMENNEAGHICIK